MPMTSFRAGFPTYALFALMLTAPAADHCTGSDLLSRDDAFLASDEGRRLLANLLTFQTPAGGWCKGYDAHQPRDTQAGKAGYGGWNGTPTIDNGATWSEITLLARVAATSGREEYRLACQRGISFLLARQYPNGGWPQRSPLDPGDHQYGTHITFNDNAMTEVLGLLMDIGDDRHPAYAFIEPDLRQQIATAVERGIDCILRCQIEVAGQPTVWCQQHDEQTLAATSARAYELPALSSSESARIVRLLMRIERPDIRVRRAITAAQSWFARTAITGKRIAERPDPSVKGGRDRSLVDDPGAPPLWARYYDIENGRPFFCGRDGVKRWSLAEIDAERRNGYAWYGNWGESLARDHARWIARIADVQAP